MLISFIWNDFIRTQTYCQVTWIFFTLVHWKIHHLFLFRFLPKFTTKYGRWLNQLRFRQFYWYHFCTSVFYFFLFSFSLWLCLFFCLILHNSLCCAAENRHYRIATKQLLIIASSLLLVFNATHDLRCVLIHHNHQYIKNFQTPPIIWTWKSKWTLNTPMWVFKWNGLFHIRYKLTSFIEHYVHLMRDSIFYRATRFKFEKKIKHTCTYFFRRRRLTFAQ